METLYHQTNKLVQETQHLFGQLERKQANLDAQAVENEIEAKIQSINRYRPTHPPRCCYTLVFDSCTLVYCSILFRCLCPIGTRVVYLYIIAVFLLLGIFNL